MGLSKPGQTSVPPGFQRQPQLAPSVHTSYDNIHTASKRFSFFSTTGKCIWAHPHNGSHGRGCSTPFWAAAQPFISSAALEEPKLQLGPNEPHELLGEEKTWVTRTANAPNVLLLVNSCLLIAIKHQDIQTK